MNNQSIKIHDRQKTKTHNYILYTYITLQLYYNDHDDKKMDFKYSANISHRHDWTLSKWHVYIYDSDTSVINNY